VIAVQLVALGVVADILAASRTLQQRTLERVRRVELTLGVEPSHYEPRALRDPSRTTGAASGPATGKPERAGEADGGTPARGEDAAEQGAGDAGWAAAGRGEPAERP